MQKLLLAASIILVMAVLFGGASLFEGFSTPRFVSAALLGAFAGFAGLPMVNPKAFKERPGWCSLIGGIAFGALSYSRGATPDIIFGMIVLGAVAGAFAPGWVRYVSP